MGVSTQPATGARGAVRVGEETNFGVAVIPTHVIDFTSEGLAATETVLTSEAIRSDRGVHKLIQGNLDVSGDVSFEQSASGYGMILRHALGDYARVPGADGGIHGRLGEAAETTITGIVDSEPDRFILPLTDDQSTIFADAAATFAVIYKDANSDDALTVDDNTGAGYSYTSFCGAEQTYVVTTGSDSAHSGGVTSAPFVEVADVLDADGNLVAPDFSTAGGLVKIGDNRTEYAYWEYLAGAGGGANGSKLYFNSAPTAVADDGVIGRPGFAKETSSIGLPAAALRKGTWVFEFNVAWLTTEYSASGTSTTATVFTHFLERGVFLPVGLTVEIDRDAAIFVYTGCKVASLTLNFETNAIVTGTVSFTGKQEYAMAELVSDAAPGETSIKVDDVTAFPSTGGTLTVGEETGITYTGWTDNLDGTYDITGIPASGSASIERFHPEGSNVDSRTSREATIIEFDYDAATGVWAAGDDITFDGTETGTVLAVNGTTPTGRLRVQLDANAVPVDNDALTSSGTGDGAVNGTPVVVAPYIGDNSPMTSFETLVHVDGTLEEVLSGSLTLNNNLNGDKFGLGSRFRLQLVEEQANVEASLTMEFDDGKHYKRFLKSDLFTLEFKCISEAEDSEVSTFGVLSGAYYFMPKCKYTGTTPVIGSTSFIQHDMPVTCIVDDENTTSDLIIILVNDNPDDVELGGLRAAGAGQ